MRDGIGSASMKSSVESPVTQENSGINVASNVLVTLTTRWTAGMPPSNYQAANAAFAAAVVCGVLVSRQSGSPGLSASNQIRPRTSVAISILTKSVIHCALSPPILLQPTSLIQTGLFGAIDEKSFSVWPNKSAGWVQRWPPSTPKL